MHNGQHMVESADGFTGKYGVSRPHTPPILNVMTTLSRDTTAAGRSLLPQYMDDNMRNAPGNVFELNSYRTDSQQAVVDDISARAFIYLREAAEAAGVSMRTVLAEHLLGISLVVEAVEGTTAARQLLAAVDDKLGQVAVQ